MQGHEHRSLAGAEIRDALDESVRAHGVVVGGVVVVSVLAPLAEVGDGELVGCTRLTHLKLNENRLRRLPRLAPTWRTGRRSTRL